MWRLVGYNGNSCKTRSLPGPCVCNRSENFIVFVLPSYKGPTATIRAEPSVRGRTGMTEVGLCGRARVRATARIHTGMSGNERERSFAKRTKHGLVNK